MTQVSSKPYLIRALFEWCVDSGLTPYLSVAVNEQTRVPVEHVKNGEIVLNLSPSATRDLKLDNDWIQFSARFSGTSREVSVPVDAVIGIFARENGQGMFFQSGVPVSRDASTPSPDNPDGKPTPPQKRGKPNLQLIK